MKKLLAILILGTFLLAMLPGVNALVTYTPSTMTTCENNICTKTLYSGTTNVYEDGIWKPVEEARSLKDKGFEIKILEDDKDFPVEVVDFNYTSITVKLNPDGLSIFGEDVPIRIWDYDEEKADIFDQEVLDGKEIVEGLAEDYKDIYTNVLDEEISYWLLNQEEEMVLDFGLGSILEFGYNSTSIILQDADTENLDDTKTSSLQPTYDFGTRDYNFISPRGGVFLKFNISSILQYSIIENANLSLTMEAITYMDAGESYNTSSHHVYNYPSFSINGEEWTEGDGDGTNDCNGNELCYSTQPDEETEMNYTPESIVNLDSTLNVGDIKVWNISNMLAKSLSEGYKNLTILLNSTIHTGSPTGDEGFYMASKEHATSNYRPYVTITYSPPPLSINITYPTNTSYSTTTPTTLNWTVGGYAEESCWYSNDTGTTNTSVTCGDLQVPINFVDGQSTYFMWANDSSGNEVTDNVTFIVDATPPTISIESPVTIYNYIYQNYNLTLNTTIIDTLLDTCWYEYNNTNTTFPCTNGTKSNTGFLYEPDINNIRIWANDSAGNQHSNFTSWAIKVFENSRTINPTSYETQNETFAINITANSSLSAVTLDYNGTEYSTTKSGTTYSKTLDTPTGVQNRSVRWKFTYAGDPIYSTYTHQNISLLNFSICDATLTEDFLNISFKDEADERIINASVPTSTFEYYLGTGTVYKTLTYVSNDLNYNYTFCATPTTETLKINPYFQYKQGADYPQRIWNADLTEYTSTVTHQTLYLLKSVDGLYVTFQVLSAGNTPLEGTEVTGSRTIVDTVVEVAQGTTDAAGSVTFWLNPDFSHTFIFVKTGYDTYTTTITPTQSTYTINLGTSTTSTIDYAKEISTSVKPLGSYVLNDSLINFNYTISTSYWLLDRFGFTLSYGNGTEIGTEVSTSDVGGTIGLDATTGSSGTIIMNYYYVINSTYTNGTNTWNVYKTSAYGISHLFERVSTYIDADIMGVQGDDEGYFFKAILSIFILITVTGILSTKYGLASEQAITGMIFGILMVLNSMNLIPTPSHLNVDLGNMVVFLVGMIAAALIFKEEAR